MFCWDVSSVLWNVSVYAGLVRAESTVAVGFCAREYILWNFLWLICGCGVAGFVVCGHVLG